MKILKITKKKNNLYTILLSDKTSLSFYDDTIIKFNLLKPRDLEEKELKEIIAFNNKASAYNTALKYIMAKLRTKKEIKNKLKDYSNDVINDTIKRLEDSGLLSDKLYVKSYIADQVNLTLKGPKKIIKELEKLGFSSTLIIEEIKGYEKEIWQEKIKKLVTKSLNTNHNLSKIMLINKIKTNLINNGYDVENINGVITKIDIEESPDAIKKEYQKNYKKLSRKYSGETLKNKIKYNLYKKGFSMSDIDVILEKEKGL